MRIAAATACIACLISTASADRPVEEPMLGRWMEFSRSAESRELVLWLRCQARARMTGTECVYPLRIDPPPYFGKLGMFITIIRGKRVRGCFGAFAHRTADIRSLLADYLDGAMTRDPRYPPIRIAELPESRIILTVTSPPWSVEDARSIDTLRHGAVLECNGETIIFVPAEIRNGKDIDDMARNRSCQVYAFTAVAIR